MIALYKAFSGGEWFEASLESVRAHTRGAVVVFSDRPWVAGLPLREDCRAPLARFRARRPGYPVAVLRGDYRDQADQYRDGLARIAREWGPDAPVLVVDTDEVWEPEALHVLRSTMAARPRVDYFTTRLRTYLKSPLYRVEPQEGARCVVGLQHPRVPCLGGRFVLDGARTSARLHLDALAFHHLSYVRGDERAVRAKFLNTGGQERVPSDYTWFDRVWNALPAGRDLHMTVGFESAWRGVKVVCPHALPALVRAAPAYRRAVDREDARWRDRVRMQPTAEALVPAPTQRDAHRYAAELAAHLPKGRDLLARLKTTVYEALRLIEAASHVPADGRILEIGSGAGGSMACLALGSDPSVRLVSVDPFAPYDEATHAGTVRGVREGDEAAFWRTADAFGFRDRVDLVKRTSADAASQFEDGAFDLVFVDGNHTEAVVAGDLRAYWPKVKPGGRLLGHDYTTRFPGAITAVDAWERESGVPVRVWQGTSLFAAYKGDGR